MQPHQNKRNLPLLLQYYRVVLGKSLMLKLLIGLFPFLIASSLCFYFFESRAGTTEYKSYWDALQGIVILMFSGFDVKPPATIGGYISSIAVMLSGIVFVTLLIGDSAAFLVEKKLKGGKGMKKLKLNNHIIICNWNEHGKTIVDQLLSEEIKEPRDIAIVADLDDCPYDNVRVQFVKGNPTKNKVLDRAKIDTADTAIVLGGEGDPQTADARAILTALALESIRPEIYTCVIIFDAENKQHLEHAHVDEIVCISEMTDSVLVQASLNHGLSSLLSGLLTFSEGCEIYKLKVSKEYQGLTFTEVSIKLLQEEHITLIGVETDVPSEDDQIERQIVSSPKWLQPLKEGDNVFVIAETFPEGFESA